MKAMMMSIRPEWVAKILNGEKTIEIRKRFPSDYVGWVYIYVTKDQNEELWWYDGTEDFRLYKKGIANEKNIGWHLQNGKVVARFWCDKVEEIKFDDKEVQKQACLTEDELFDYLFINEPYHEDMHKGYGISITKLEIFDKPKELSEFKYYKKFSEMDYMLPIPRKETCERLVTLTRSPQSWQFIEI